MRYLFGFLCVCALGVVPVVGCGETGGAGGSGGTAATGGMGGGGSGGAPECESDADCNDHNQCTFDQCANGLCDHLLSEPGVECDFGGLPGRCSVSGICVRDCGFVECDDFNVCTYDSCDPADGMCSYEPVDCADFNDCTAETCDPAVGCEQTSLADGTQCAGGTCRAGVCALSGTVLPCTEQGIRNAIAAGDGPYTFSCGGPKIVTTNAEIVIDNDVKLDGEGDLTVDGNEHHRVFSVPEGVTAELHGFAVTRGEAGEGGGVFNAGTLSIGNSRVSGNTILDAGCLIANGQGRGGGIYNAGTLTVTGSLISGNKTRPCSFQGRGGGIFAAVGTLTLTNSTVSGNSTGRGGGIFAADGTLTMINSTVSGNTAESVFIGEGGTLALTNSLVDGNCFGDITSNGYNIESPDDTCGFDQESDQVDVTEGELDLQPLANNGGLTMTHAITADSAAFDAGGACEVNTDQRGVDRPQGDACDVGAFELEQP